MLYLDYLAYNNALRNVSVLEKMLLGGGSLLMVLLMPQTIILITVIILMHGVMLYAKVPVSYLVQLWLTPLAFLVTGLITVIVSGSLQPFPALILWQIGPLYLGVTIVGLMTAQTLLLHSTAAVSCLFMLATTTPVAHIAAYLSRFAPLRLLMEISLLTYRFIFVFMESVGQIYLAQQSRLGYTGMKCSLKSLSLLAGNVGRKSFITATNLYTALLARNYGDQLVFQYSRQPVNPVRLILIAGLLAALCAMTLIG